MGILTEEMKRVVAQTLIEPLGERLDLPSGVTDAA